MQVKAVSRNLRISPRKLGLVAGLVRGRSVADSLVILDHTPKRGAPLLSSTIKSAVANAENNFKLEASKLAVTTVLVSPGPTLKRWRAAARGSVHTIRHRSANLTVILDEVKTAASKEAKNPRKRTPVKSAGAN